MIKMYKIQPYVVSIMIGQIMNESKTCNNMVCRKFET